MEPVFCCVKRAAKGSNSSTQAGDSDQSWPRFLKPHEKGVTIRVKVSPNSSKNELNFGSEEWVSARLTCPPVEGKANKELIKLMGKRLKVPPSSISILHGLTSREKILLVPGLTETEIIKKLSE